MSAGWMIPYKLQAIRRRFGSRPFRLLDVGCGNHSPAATKRWLPEARYTGIDRSREYELDARDFELMDEFLEMDLETPDLTRVPGEAFDAIVVAHVIEHLPNGDELLRGLSPKLRPGGLLYVEFPGERSLRLPSRRGCLNFHDDPTHVRLYTASEVSTVLAAAGLRVIQAGTRRDPRAIALLPLRALKSKLDHGYVAGSVFWDLLGFADFVLAERTPA